MFITVINCSLQQQVKSACRLICTGTPEDRGGIHPSVLSKGAQRGRRCLFMIGLRAGKFLVGEGFLPEFPQTSTKSFLCNFYLQMLSHKDHEDLFGVTSKKGPHMIFCKPLGRHFLKSSKVGRHFHADFQGCCPDFQQIKKRLSPTSNKHHCFS